MGLSLLQEAPRQAMLHFEKCPSILIQIGRSSNSENVIRAHMLIAQAQLEMPGTDKRQHWKHFQNISSAFSKRNRSFKHYKWNRLGFYLDLYGKI
jgi:hypothetical protein